MYSFIYKLILVSLTRGIDIVIDIFIIYLIIIIINYVTLNSILIRIKNPTLSTYLVLPHSSSSIPLILLYPTYLTLHHISHILLYPSHSTLTQLVLLYPPIKLYLTHLTISHSSHSILSILLYPTYPTLPHLIYTRNTNKNYKREDNKTTSSTTSTTSTRYST